MYLLLMYILRPVESQEVQIMRITNWIIMSDEPLSQSNNIKVPVLSVLGCRYLLGLRTWLLLVKLSGLAMNEVYTSI